MSYFILKCLAVIFMFLDHIGSFFGIFSFRLIGRLSFPIFAFLVSNGLKYTKSPIKYALRLLFFAIISEIPFDIAFGGGLTLKTLDNVFFTLFLGLVFLIILKELRSRFKDKKLLIFIISLFSLAVICGIALIVSCDYGYIGVLTVAIFGILEPENRFYKPFVSFGLLMLSGWRLWSYLIYSGFYAIGFNLHSIWGVHILFSNTPPLKWDCLQLLRLVALIPIFLYNGKNGQSKNKLVEKILKYGFYLFYPLHILILYYIKKFI